MKSYIVKVLPGGRITIPVEIRRELSLEPGDVLAWRDEGPGIYGRKVQPGETVESMGRRNAPIDTALDEHDERPEGGP